MSMYDDEDWGNKRSQNNKGKDSRKKPVDNKRRKRQDDDEADAGWEHSCRSWIVESDS